MTNKERLEEIETKYSTLTVSSERGGIEYIEVDVKDLVFLIQNGFKQAERVQESKEENINLKAIKAGNEELIKILEQQNKRYREAIESMKSEINYALHSKKGKDVKRHYLENAIKYADKALEVSK